MEDLFMLQQVVDTSTFQSNQKQQLHTIIHHFYRLLTAMCIMQSPICWKAETAFNIRLSDQSKNINRSKSIFTNFHFRESVHSFKLYAKFILFEQLSIIHVTDKDTLKFRLKRHGDF